MREQQSAVDFYGTILDVIDHNGKRWLTAEQVGICLGYSKAAASSSIRKLYNRHQDRFDEQDTCRVKLARQGQVREILVFSDTGCVTLGWLANTKRAAEFQRVAKRILATHISLPAVSAPANAPPQLAESMAQMAQNVGTMAQNVGAIAGHMGTLAGGMKTVLTQMNMTSRYIGLLEIHQTGKRQVTPAIREQVKAMALEGLPYADIGRLLRISRTTVSLIARGLYPETKVCNPPTVSVSERIDEWIGREQQRLAGEIAQLAQIEEGAQ